MTDIMDKKLECLKAELEKMYAVELLEYHDKNHLSGNDKSRCETRLEQLKYAMELVAELTSHTLSKENDQKLK